MISSNVAWAPATIGYPSDTLSPTLFVSLAAFEFVPLEIHEVLERYTDRRSLDKVAEYIRD